MYYFYLTGILRLSNVGIYFISQKVSGNHVKRLTHANGYYTLVFEVLHLLVLVLQIRGCSYSSTHWFVSESCHIILSRWKLYWLTCPLFNKWTHSKQHCVLVSCIAVSILLQDIYLVTSISLHIFAKMTSSLYNKHFSLVVLPIHLYMLLLFTYKHLLCLQTSYNYSADYAA